MAEARGLAGYAWMKQWQHTYEGPATLLMKLQWANSLEANELSRILCSRDLARDSSALIHARSLVAPVWIPSAEPDSDHKELRDLIAGAGLHRYTRIWASRIAADDHFRYCPSCLVAGFQPAFFQIDALVRCPVHHEPLLSNCGLCGHLTPRYALDTHLFQSPFQCEACGMPYATTCSPDNWGASTDLGDAVAWTKLATWLRQLDTCSLEWGGWNDWQGPWFDKETSRKKRIETFEILTRFFKLELADDCFDFGEDTRRIYRGSQPFEEQRPCHFFGEAESSRGGPELATRRQIYKAIRRHLQKIYPSIEAFDPEISNDGHFVLSNKECVTSQLFLLWRMRCEEPASIRTKPLRSRDLTLRDSCLNWPTNSTVDTHTWAGFLLATFHALVELVKQWHMRAAKLGDTDIYGADRDAALALHLEFLRRLDYKNFPVLPSITTLIQRKEGVGLCRTYVVGPPLAPLTLCQSLCSPESTCRKRHALSRLEPDRARFHRAVSGQFPRNAMTTHVVPEDFKIVCLERLVLDQWCDGSAQAGERFIRGCRLEATDDIAALHAWLHFLGVKEATATIYLHEVETCLLWIVATKRKALSLIDENDAVEFANFLINPQPAEKWIGRKFVRTSDSWRPFVKPLSLRSRDYSIGVLTQFFSWLAAHRYVEGNPFHAVPFGARGETRRKFSPSTFVLPKDCCVTQDEWNYVRSVINSLDDSPYHVLSKAVLYTAYYCALSPSELAAIGLEDTGQDELNDGRVVWSIEVKERPKASRTVFMLPQAQEAIIEYATIRATFSSWPKHEEGLFFELVEIRGEPADHTERLREDLNARIRPLFAAAAMLARQAGDLEAAMRLDLATLRWLTNALCMHAHNSEVDGSWLWTILGATHGFSPYTQAYLPGKRSLSIDAYEAALLAVEHMEGQTIPRAC